MFVCLLDKLILGFCYSDLTLETGGVELALTITPLLQANRLTKCATQNAFNIKMNNLYFSLLLKQNQNLLGAR